MNDLKQSMSETLANANRKIEEEKEKRRQAEILNYGHVLTDQEREYYANQIKQAEIEEKLQRKRKLEVQNWIATVPKIYKTATFDNFRVDDRRQQAILNFMRKLQSAILYGPNGPGKTYLGYSGCLEIVKQGKKALLTTAFKMFKEIKRRFPTHTDEEYLSYLKHLDYLVIDEVDKKYGSVTDFLNLCEIISDREANELPTVLIANAKKETDLVEILGTSVIDRIAGAGKIIEMNWESRR